MRIIVKIWDGSNESPTVADINAELNDTNLDLIYDIIDAYAPKPTCSADGPTLDIECKDYNMKVEKSEGQVYVNNIIYENKVECPSCHGPYDDDCFG